MVSDTNHLEGFKRPIHQFCFLAYMWAEDISKNRKLNNNVAKYISEVFHSINIYTEDKDFNSETVRLYKRKLREKRILDLDINDIPYYPLEFFVNEMDSSLINDFALYEQEVKNGILNLSDEFVQLCKDIDQNRLYTIFLQNNNQFFTFLFLKLFPCFNNWMIESQNLRIILVECWTKLLREDMFTNLFNEENQQLFSDLTIKLLDYANTNFYRFLLSNQLLGFPLLPAFNEYTLHVNKIKNGEDTRGYISIVPIFDQDLMTGLSIFSAFPLDFLSDYKDDDHSRTIITETFQFFFKNIFSRLLKYKFSNEDFRYNIQPYLDSIDKIKLIKTGGNIERPFLAKFIIDEGDRIMGVNCSLTYKFLNPVQLNDSTNTREIVDGQIQKFSSFIINSLPKIFENIDPSKNYTIKLSISEENEETPRNFEFTI